MPGEQSCISNGNIQSMMRFLSTIIWARKEENMMFWSLPHPLMQSIILSQALSSTSSGQGLWASGFRMQRGYLSLPWSAETGARIITPSPLSGEIPSAKGIHPIKGWTLTEAKTSHSTNNYLCCILGSQICSIGKTSCGMNTAAITLYKAIPIPYSAGQFLWGSTFHFSRSVTFNFYAAKLYVGMCCFSKLPPQRQRRSICIAFSSWQKPESNTNAKKGDNRVKPHKRPGVFSWGKPKHPTFTSWEFSPPDLLMWQFPRAGKFRTNY